MHNGQQDFLTTVRALRRAPAFALVVIGTLAIAMAANTVIFSVINAVARPELPYRDADRLVSITEAYSPYGWTDVPASLATFVELGGAHSFCSDVATHTQRRVCTRMPKAPARLQAAVVSANLWNTLGVSPILGRGFSESDNRAEGAHPVIIGHRVWRERYGSSRTCSAGRRSSTACRAQSLA